MEALVLKYSPVLYFHSNEKYFPCSIDWLLKYSTLVDFKANINIKSPTQKELFDLSKKYDFKRVGDGEVVLSFDEEIYRGQQPLSDVPCYAILRQKDNFIYITYIFLYPYNGSYEIAGLVGLGEHPGDLEHITVECKTDGSINRVFFGAHGTEDGRWVKPEDVEFSNGHIVCYVAYSGHGLYNKSGEVFRFGGFANDRLDAGIKWEPKPIIMYQKEDPKFNVNTMGWSTYNGRIGGRSDKMNTDGIMGLPDKPWFNYGDNIDENFYKPPRIISETFEGPYNFISNFFKFLIIYFIIYGVKYSLDKSIFPKIPDSFVLQSMIVSIISLGLYHVYSYVGKALLIKFVPS